MKIAMAFLLLAPMVSAAHARTTSVYAASSRGPALAGSCTRYAAGMNTLASDVNRFVISNWTAPVSVSVERVQERGLRRELRNILHANGTPGDNEGPKLNNLISDALYSVRYGVNRRMNFDDVARFNSWMKRASAGLSNVGVLLREVCLPSSVRHLPCTGTCVLDLVGSGRVYPYENPLHFVFPIDYKLRASWDCGKAYEKAISITLFGYHDDSLPVQKYAVGPSGSETWLEEWPQQHRNILYIRIEQSCRWRLTVTNG